jgi:hypothetical protein
MFTDDTLDQCGVRAAEQEALLLVTIIAFERRLVKVHEWESQMVPHFLRGS